MLFRGLPTTCNPKVSKPKQVLCHHIPRFRRHALAPRTPHAPNVICRPTGKRGGDLALANLIQPVSDTSQPAYETERQELEHLFRAAQTWPSIAVQSIATQISSSVNDGTQFTQQCLAHEAQDTSTTDQHVPEEPEAQEHQNVASNGMSHVMRVQLGNGPEPPKEKILRERHDDFYANVGDAIRTLREDIPALFSADLNYSIYRDDVVFRDPRNCFRGMKNYQTIFWSLRFHGRLFFQDLFVDVVRIWQKTDDTICMRWTVYGMPRVPWDAEGIFDGVSTYRVDSHGKIYEHRVDNVIFRDPPVLRIPLLARITLSPVPQQPVPGAWFQGIDLCPELNFQTTLKEETT